MSLLRKNYRVLASKRTDVAVCHAVSLTPQLMK
jgi:hypothetical protein